MSQISIKPVISSIQIGNVDPPGDGRPTQVDGKHSINNSAPEYGHRITVRREKVITSDQYGSAFNRRQKYRPVEPKNIAKIAATSCQFYGGGKNSGEELFHHGFSCVREFA